ncbi:MAG: hypothetical protein QW835_00055 [Candidatus Hadarchaeum sp.]
MKNVCFINRQPTLFRHSMPGVAIIPSSDDDVIGVSPLFVEPLNMDFDGDTAAVYVPHDEGSINECLEKAFLTRYVHYDQNSNFLSVIRHEILYGAYVLTTVQPEGDPRFEVDSLNDLPEIQEYICNPSFFVLVADEKVSYALALFNKWCGFDRVRIREKIDKRRADFLSEQIFKSCTSIREFYDRLTRLSNKLLFFITVSSHCPTLDIDEMLVLSETDEEFFQKLPENPSIGHLINEALTERVTERLTGSLRWLLDSGSRFNRRQFARSFVNIGYVADANNQIDSVPVRTNLLSGLSFHEFFMSSKGTRKSLIDKEYFTPQAGYLERTLVMGLSPVEFAADDCGDDEGFKIPVISKTHASTLVGKFFKATETEPWREFKKEDMAIFQGKEIYIRSPLTCLTPDLKICRTCFGTKWIPTKYVGVTAGQVLVERITQLILRTFHTSGAAELNFPKELKFFVRDHLVSLSDDGEHLVLEFDRFVPEDLAGLFRDLKGFVSVEGDKVRFCKSLTEVLSNNDVIYYFSQISKIMRKARPLEQGILDYYLEFMGILCELGEIYSSYAEILFCNSFLVSAKVSPENIWRYNKTSPPVMKLGRNQYVELSGGILSLLFTPNQRTLKKKGLESLNMENPPRNIYEKLLRF